jgi:hypothetical protein
MCQQPSFSTAASGEAAFGQKSARLIARLRLVRATRAGRHGANACSPWFLFRKKLWAGLAIKRHSFVIYRHGTLFP